jgi:tRNA (guanine37-N1)-methyltransferase
MRIDIISAAPDLLESPFNHSIIKRAKEKGLAEVVIHDLRTFGLGNYRQIDDTQFGGGAGMVLMIEPISKCIDALKAERRYDEIIYMTPDISIGDYVLTGGELAAAVLVDSIVRLIPGVIGDETSALTDSFQDNLLSPPVYTRPSNYEGMKVPEILLSGNFPKIDEWRSDKAYERTQQIRPDLLDETS